MDGEEEEFDTLGHIQQIHGITAKMSIKVCASLEIKNKLKLLLEKFLDNKSFVTSTLERLVYGDSQKLDSILSTLEKWSAQYSHELQEIRNNIPRLPDDVLTVILEDCAPVLKPMVLVCKSWFRLIFWHHRLKKLITFRCNICHKTYIEDQNHDRACRSHIYPLEVQTVTQSDNWGSSYHDYYTLRCCQPERRMSIPLGCVFHHHVPVCMFLMLSESDYLRILQHLRPRDLTRFCRASKLFKTVSSHPKLWGPLMIEDFPTSKHHPSKESYKHIVLEKKKSMEKERKAQQKEHLAEVERARMEKQKALAKPTRLVTVTQVILYIGCPKTSFTAFPLSVELSFQHLDYISKHITFSWHIEYHEKTNAIATQSVNYSGLEIYPDSYPLLKKKYTVEHSGPNGANHFFLQTNEFVRTLKHLNATTHGRVGRSREVIKEILEVTNEGVFELQYVQKHMKLFNGAPRYVFKETHG